MVTIHNEIPLGMSAPDFDLQDVTRDSFSRVSLASLSEFRALLIVFACNHCPFVRHIENALGNLASRYMDSGLTTIAISSNDVVAFPEDDEEHMREQAVRAGWNFPYLLDADQSVARAYGAACTPDLFLFDARRTLAYRGEFDGSRPDSGVAASGDSLRGAVELVLAAQEVPLPHRALIGCGIKWAPGNEPV
jgi:peroxiredoxin